MSSDRCQTLALAITPPGQAQVGKVAPAKGGAIYRNPEGQQVKALGHPLRVPHRQHVVAIGGSWVGVGLPTAQLEKRGGRAWRIDFRQTITIGPDAGAAARADLLLRASGAGAAAAGSASPQVGALAAHIGGNPAAGIGQLMPGQPRQYHCVGAQGIAV